MKYSRSVAHAMAFAPDDDDMTVSAYTEDREEHPHEVGLIDFDEQRSGCSVVTPTPSHLSVGSAWSRYSALTTNSTASEVGVEEMEVGKRELGLVGYSPGQFSTTGESERGFFECVGVIEEDDHVFNGGPTGAQEENGTLSQYSPLANGSTSMQSPPPYSTSAVAASSVEPSSIDVRVIAASRLCGVVCDIGISLP